MAENEISRRDRIATACLAALLSREDETWHCYAENHIHDRTRAAKYAVACADALITELNKKENP